MAEKLQNNFEQGGAEQAPADNGWDTIGDEVPFAKAESNDDGAVENRPEGRLQSIINKAKAFLEKITAPRMTRKEALRRNMAAFTQEPWSETNMEGLAFMHNSYQTLFDRVQNHEHPSNDEITDAVGDSMGIYGFDKLGRQALGSAIGDLMGQAGEYDQFDVIRRPANLFDEYGNKIGETGFEIQLQKNNGGAEEFSHITIHRSFAEDGSPDGFIASLQKDEFDIKSQGGANNRKRLVRCGHKDSGGDGYTVLSFEMGPGASEETTTEHFGEVKE